MPEAQEAFGYAAKVEFPEKQREWFKNVLAANTDVRWTFVFPHEPVWDNPSDSFKEIDEAIHVRLGDFDRLVLGQGGGRHGKESENDSRGKKLPHGGLRGSVCWKSPAGNSKALPGTA